MPHPRNVVAMRNIPQCIDQSCIVYVGRRARQARPSPPLSRRTPMTERADPCGNLPEEDALLRALAAASHAADAALDAHGGACGCGLCDDLAWLRYTLQL